MDNKIKEYYNRIKDLEYSEENIAELYSILLNLISEQVDIDGNRKTNKFLNYIMLTHEKESELFKSSNRDQWETNFNELKSNLLADLRHSRRLIKE